VTGAAAYRGFACGEFPLRDASADLDICRGESVYVLRRRVMLCCKRKCDRKAARATYSSIFEICASVSHVAGHVVGRRGSQSNSGNDSRRYVRIIPLRYPSSRKLGQSRIGRARIWRDRRDWRCGRSHVTCVERRGDGGVEQRYQEVGRCIGRK
jgi:hypothetical protein